MIFRHFYVGLVKKFHLCRVIFFVLVESDQPTLGLENFPIKIPNFTIFSPSEQKKSYWVGSKNTQVKDGSASYLLRVKSMLESVPISSGNHVQQI